MKDMYHRYLDRRARKNGINWIANAPTLPAAHRRNLNLLDRELNEHLRQVEKEQRSGRDLPVITGDSYHSVVEEELIVERRGWGKAELVLVIVAALAVAWSLGSAWAAGDLNDVVLGAGIMALILGWMAGRRG